MTHTHMKCSKCGFMNLPIIKRLEENPRSEGDFLELDEEPLCNLCRACEEILPIDLHLQYAGQAFDRALQLLDETCRSTNYINTYKRAVGHLASLSVHLVEVQTCINHALDELAELAADHHPTEEDK